MTISTEQEYLELTEVPSLIVDRALTRTKPLHILYSYEYRRPVAATNWLATINSLGHRHLNCYIQFGINQERNSTNDYKFPSDWKASRGWLWQYDINLQKFVYEPGDMTWDELFYFRLTSEKAAAIDRIHNRINNTRRYYVSEINSQHTVYTKKAQEARQFLADPQENPDVSQYPFLISYASLAGLDLEYAAREIALQADFTESRLIETELIRIKYTRAVHESENILEVKGVINDFYRETVGHANT